MMKLCRVNSVPFSACVAKKGTPFLLSGGLSLLLFCLPDEDVLQVTDLLSLSSRFFRGPKGSIPR